MNGLFKKNFLRLYLSTGRYTLNKKSNIPDSLITKLCLGDLKAFKEIYDIYRLKVTRLAYRYCLEKADAEEVLQDVFMKLWNNKEKINPCQNFDNFIFTITKNTVLDKIKSYKLEKENLSKYFVHHKPVATDQTEQHILYSELQQLLAEVLIELPPKRRRIFEMNRLEGYTYQQITEALQISSGTVEKQMSKALKVVKKKLTGYKLLVVVIIIFLTA